MTSFFSRAGAFVFTHWRAIAALVPILVLAALLLVRTDQRDDARLQRDQARAEAARVAAESEVFARRVDAEAQRIQRTAAETALRVERDQARISEEVSHDYQARIADLHRRVAALQLRSQPAQGGADPGGGGDAMPGLPVAAGGSDGAPAPAGLPADAAVLATEQAIQLDELQRWIRDQQAVDRSPAPADR